MNYLATLTIVAIAILAIGMVTAPAFADSQQIKIQNKQNNHMKCDGNAICAGQGGNQDACSGTSACQIVSAP
jgi:hypothetical protein